MKKKCAIDRFMYYYARVNKQDVSQRHEAVRNAKIVFLHDTIGKGE